MKGEGRVEQEVPHLALESGIVRSLGNLFTTFVPQGSDSRELQRRSRQVTLEEKSPECLG